MSFFVLCMMISFGHVGKLYHSTSFIMVMLLAFIESFLCSFMYTNQLQTGMNMNISIVMVFFFFFFTNVSFALYM